MPENKFHLLKINTRGFYLLGTFLAFFTYLYPVDFNFLPVDTGRILYLFGFMYVLFFKAAKISYKVYRVLSLSFLLLFASFSATIVCNNAYDFSFSLKVTAIIFYAFGAILTVDLMKKYIKGFSVYVVLEWLVYAAVVQAILSLVVFFVPAAKDLYFAFTRQPHETVELHAAYRLIAISKFQYANAAVMYGLAMFAAITLAFCNQSKLYKNKAIYSISLLLIIIAGVLSARTFFLMLALAFCYYAYLLWHQKGFFKALGKILFILVLGVACVVFVFFFFEGSEYRRTYQWAFEGFINLAENGNLGTSSTSKLQSMYIYPEQLKTWLVGDGKMVDGEGNFYMHTDAGYIRHIFYWGILGSILFYSVQYAYYSLVLKSSDLWLMKRFYMLLFVWFFIYNIKDCWLPDLYWILFISASTLNVLSNSDIHNLSDCRFKYND